MVLSPNGRYASVEGPRDEFQVYDTRTGRQVPFTTETNYAFVFGYQWTSPTTFAAIGLRSEREDSPWTSGSARSVHEARGDHRGPGHCGPGAGVLALLSHRGPTTT